MTPTSLAGAAMPRLRAAIAAHKQLNHSDQMPGETRGQMRLRHYLMGQDWRATQERAYKAMAEELLPILLPGDWISTGRQWFSYSTDRSRLVENNHNLFDHPRYFRRKGARGALTWDNAVVTGEPYHEPLSEIPEYLATYGLDTILAGKSLSPWNPGATHLVIVGKKLDLLAAEQLGFRILAHA